MAQSKEGSEVAKGHPVGIESTRESDEPLITIPSTESLSKNIESRLRWAELSKQTTGFRGTMTNRWIGKAQEGDK